MTNNEKIARLQAFTSKNHREFEYYDLLEEFGDLKSNYSDYMTSEPINCDYELRRTDGADYELATALLTMMLREDHFSNGSFEKRLRLGQVDKVIDRMIEALMEEDAKELNCYLPKEVLVKIGQIKRMKLISNAVGFGTLPLPGKEAEQHLSICSDGRVYFSRYCFVEDLNYRQERYFNEQFKISPSRANYILSLIGMFFEESFVDMFATDVGTWELELINEKDEKFCFNGSLCCDVIFRNEQASRLIREFTDRPHMYCFDGDARDALEVDEDELIFVDVYLDEYDRSYTYICEDKLITEDDEVVIPFGAKNTELIGCVEKVQVLKRDEAPYPVEKCKKVIRRL